MTAPGTLWLVPAPLDLGGPEVDIADALPLGTLRRAAALAHWVVEDARTARAVLRRVGAVVPLAQPLQALSIAELPRPAKGGAAPRRGEPARAQAAAAGPAAVPAAMSALLQPALAGHDVGLMSEAGLPAVADPGAELVAAAHALGVPVQPLPGASSLLLALAASGCHGQSFAFVGYLPQEPGARAERLLALQALSRRERQTQLFIETPYRNAALLETALAVLAPTTRLAVGCALTLPGGFTRSDTVAGWRARPQALPARQPAVFSLLAG